MPPTGREIDCEQIHVLALREGRVVGHEAVRDDVTTLQQLGVFPPPPAVALRMAAWEGERAGHPGGGGGYAVCCGGGFVGVTGLRGGGFGVTERSGGGFGVTGRGREGECR
ncbi:hypothetical protein ACPC27_13620 [Streptomyces cellulosae]